MDAEIDTILQYIDKEVTRLSEEFKKKKQYFMTCLLMMSKSQTQKCDNISTYNVFLHAKAEAANEGKSIQSHCHEISLTCHEGMASGDKEHLMEIVADSKMEYGDLTEEEKQSLVRSCRLTESANQKAGVSMQSHVDRI